MHPFEALTPPVVLPRIEEAYGLTLESSLVRHNSYINRVFGLRDTEGRDWVAKFYRPGRWTGEALDEEHFFLLDAQESGVRVAAPQESVEGATLVNWGPWCGLEEAWMALLPRVRGRSFDPEGEESWVALGRLVGALHREGRRDNFIHRPRLDPQNTTALQIKNLLTLGLGDPALEADFRRLSLEGLEKITPLFQGLPVQRIHGDCHRGNILSTDSGLVLLDFDDCAQGPVVQDLWLLLPGYREDCGREMGLILAGYEEFASFDPRWWDLVEPLRFMRMIHFLSWTALQRQDPGFALSFEGWGSKGFWIKEIEDLRDQVGRL